MENDYNDDFEFVSRPYVPQNLKLDIDDLILPFNIDLKPKSKTIHPRDIPVEQYIEAQNKSSDGTSLSMCQYFDFIKICYFTNYFKKKYQIVPYPEKYHNNNFIFSIYSMGQRQLLLAILKLTSPF